MHIQMSAKRLPEAQGVCVDGVGMGDGEWGEWNSTL